MTWEILTAISIFSRSLYSVASRNLSVKVKVSAITQTFLISVVSGSINILISPFFGGIQFSSIQSNALAILFIIAASAAGNLLYFTGQKNLDAGTTQVAFSSILVWGVVLSYFLLGSHLTFTQIFGSLLLLVAIFLTQKSFKLLQPDNRSVWFIICSTLMFSLFQVLSADISKTISTGTYLFVNSFGVAFALFLIYFRKILTELLAIADKGASVFTSTLFACSTSILYFIFSYLAYQKAPDPGLVVILLTSQVILSVLLGIVFLRERDNLPKKVFAAILALVAAILIKS
jgi:drug/metabolite transporter (DMT)-like permease